MVSSSFKFLLALTSLLSVADASPFSSPTKRQSLATVYSSCVKSKTAAITFDDGPYIYHQQIVDLLDSKGAKGTFFFNGNNYDCIYSADSIARLKYSYSRGHMIGSHTWSHADLATLSSAQITDGMYRVEEAFSRILGIQPAFMRPPFGSYNNLVRQISGGRSQALAMWDWDTGDADGNNTQQAEAVYQDAVNDRVNNMLVLNHETQEMTANSIIPYAINLLQSNGYKLVTLADCLGVQPYHAVGVPQSQTSAWTCSGAPGPGEACSGSQCKSGTPVFSSTAGPSPTQPPQRTNQAIHPNGISTKCLTASSNANAAAVTISDCVAGSAAQSWSFVGFNIQVYGNKCLDVTSGSATNGNKMQIYTCGSGNANQQWQSPSSSGAIQWLNTNFCLDDTDGSTANGNVMQIYSCTGGPNQKWSITNAGTGTSTTTTPTPTGTAKTIRPGKSSTTCLTVSSNANSASVAVQPCNGGAGQSWVQTGGTLVAYGNKCLDVPSGSTANGVKMQVYTCASGNTNQQFTVTSDKRIAWTNKGECLDLTDGSLANGNVVQMYACSNGNTNQVWNFV